MDRLQKLFLVVILAVGVVVTLLQIPAIKTAQDEAYDEKASNDLQIISAEVKSYIGSKDDLPSSLQQLEDMKTQNSLSHYTYQARGGGGYELCATFRTDTQTGKSKSNDYDWLGSDYVDFTKHPKGKHCFEQSASIYRKAYDDWYNYQDTELDCRPGSSAVCNPQEN